MKPEYLIISIAAVLLVLSVLFPPWLYRCDKWPSFPAGYHFLLKRPETKRLCPSSEPLSGPPASVQLNSARLVHQLIVVGLLAGGFLLILKTPRTNLSVVGAILVLGIGAISLMLLGLEIQLGI
jgi:hypothetical protein